MARRSEQPLGLSRLQSESLAEKAYHELKRSILSGRLAPGSPLAEVELAEALGISRTPVREALALLRADGLVESIPGGGTEVRVLSPDEVRELFLLREALEALAMREYVSSPAKDIGTLERLLERQRRARTRKDVDEFLAADEEFHLTVCRDAGLPQVAQLLLSLREKMRQAGLRAVAHTGRMERVLAEHEAIVDALRAGSGAKAQRALRTHLQATRDAFESAHGLAGASS